MFKGSGTIHQALFVFLGEIWRGLYLKRTKFKNWVFSMVGNSRWWATPGWTDHDGPAPFISGENFGIPKEGLNGLSNLAN